MRYNLHFSGSIAPSSGHDYAHLPQLLEIRGNLCRTMAGLSPLLYRSVLQPCRFAGKACWIRWRAAATSLVELMLLMLAYPWISQVAHSGEEPMLVYIICHYLLILCFFCVFFLLPLLFLLLVSASCSWVDCFFGRRGRLPFLAGEVD